MALCAAAVAAVAVKRHCKGVMKKEPRTVTAVARSLRARLCVLVCHTLCVYKRDLYMCGKRSKYV